MKDISVESSPSVCRDDLELLVKELRIKNLELFEKTLASDCASNSEFQKLQSSYEDTLKKLEIAEINSSLALESISENKNLKSQNATLLLKNNELQKKINSFEKEKKKFDDAKKELSIIKKELSYLKSLSPERLKKNLSEKKSEVQALKESLKNNLRSKKQFDDLKENNSYLVKDNKNLKDAFDKCLSEEDYFFISKDMKWSLRLTGFLFSDEESSRSVLRIRCTDRDTGNSVILSVFDEEGNPKWGGDIGVPDEITDLAIRHMKSLIQNKRLLKKNEV